jgi:hypothetical protein
VPDQFSLEAFQKLEHGKKDRDPIMAEIILASSHNPWSPIARMVDWNDLGDGSIFNKIKKEGTNPTEVWKSAKRVRTEYRKAIQYSLDSLTEWVQRYGDDNTVTLNAMKIQIKTISARSNHPLIAPPAATDASLKQDTHGAEHGAWPRRPR